MSTAEYPGALSRVPDDKGVSEMKGQEVYLPEPGRDISLGSSRIPRICVLWEKHSGLTVTPARPPAGSRAPNPSPPAIYARPKPSYWRPGGFGSWFPDSPQGPLKAARWSVGSSSGDQNLGDPSPKHGIRPARPNPRRSKWGRGPPAAPAPTAPPVAERLPREWSSLNIHFMAAAGKGRSRPSEPRNSEHQPKQQRQRRRRRR